MSDTIFLLAPCMGVGKAAAVVTRRAAYLVHQAHSKTTVLLSLPALLAGDREQHRLARKLPVVLMNGCAHRCASRILASIGVQPVAAIEVAKIMAETRTGPGKARRELEVSGKRLAAAVAERMECAMNSAAAWTPTLNLPGHASTPQKRCACMTVPDRRNSDGGDGAPPRYVTLLPCQGIRRSGGRVTQRAAYCLDEDLFPGKTLLLCLPALAVSVQEDVDMLEQFPVVALNGCGARCATKIAKKYGVRPAVSVDANGTVRGFDGGRECALPDLTASEVKAGARLADVAVPVVSALLAGKRQRRRARSAQRCTSRPSKTRCCCKGSGGARKTS